MKKLIISVLMLVVMAGCGGGGGESTSPKIVGSWVEQPSINQVEGKIRFDELQVYRDERFGDYKLEGNAQSILSGQRIRF